MLQVERVSKIGDEFANGDSLQQPLELEPSHQSSEPKIRGSLKSKVGDSGETMEQRETARVKRRQVIFALNIGEVAGECPT
jgi:hypothetical protein